MNTCLASSIFMPSKPPRSTNPITSTPDPTEDELFRAEMAADGVVEIKLEARAELQKPRPKPIATQRMADEAAVPAELLKDTSGWDGDVDTGDNITFLRNGLGRDVLKKLKRGHWAIQSELDLHGHTTLAARDELARFMAHARHNGLRCVRIIHGRGTRSVNNVPLLRNKVRLSLSQRDEVLAFCDAGPADGGAGAVLVLLKSS
jgi:DNA-nicking Smr family endonuclease